jgi:hypothetical protein
MAFAGSVILGDLDDFIAPSQSCVNPLFTESKGVAARSAPAPSQPPADRRGAARLALDSDFLAPARSVGAPAKEKAGGGGFPGSCPASTARSS